MGEPNLSSRKRWGLMASALAVLAIGMMYCFSDEPPAPAEAGNQGMMLAQAPSSGHPSPGERWNILGEKAAEDGKNLQDPFSLLHETREQAVMQGKPEESIGTVAGHSPPASEAIQIVPVKEKDGGKPEWVLKGIILGTTDRLAIVSNGKETRSVTVGECFGGYVVCGIGEASLRFSGDDGEGELYLPGL